MLALRRTHVQAKRIPDGEAKYEGNDESTMLSETIRGKATGIHSMGEGVAKRGDEKIAVTIRSAVNGRNRTTIK